MVGNWLLIAVFSALIASKVLISSLTGWPLVEWNGATVVQSIVGGFISLWLFRKSELIWFTLALGALLFNLVVFLAVRFSW